MMRKALLNISHYFNSYYYNKYLLYLGGGELHFGPTTRVSGRPCRYNNSLLYIYYGWNGSEDDLL